MSETKFQRMARHWLLCRPIHPDDLASLAQLLERAAMVEGENDAASGVVATPRNEGSRPEAPWPQNRSAEAGTPVDSTAGPALPNDGDDVRTGHHSQAATPSPPRGDDLVAQLRAQIVRLRDDVSNAEAERDAANEHERATDAQKGAERDAALADCARLRVAALKAQRALNEIMGESSAYAHDEESVFADALRHINPALADTADAEKWLAARDERIRRDYADVSPKWGSFTVAPDQDDDSPESRGYWCGVNDMQRAIRALSPSTAGPRP